MNFIQTNKHPAMVSPILHYFICENIFLFLKSPCHMTLCFRDAHKVRHFNHNWFGLLLLSTWVPYNHTSPYVRSHQSQTFLGCGLEVVLEIHLIWAQWAGCMWFAVTLHLLKLFQPSSVRKASRNSLPPTLPIHPGFVT